MYGLVYLRIQGVVWSRSSLVKHPMMSSRAVCEILGILYIPIEQQEEEPKIAYTALAAREETIFKWVLLCILGSLQRVDDVTGR